MEDCERRRAIRGREEGEVEFGTGDRFGREADGDGFLEARMNWEWKVWVWILFEVGVWRPFRLSSLVNSLWRTAGFCEGFWKARG